MVKPSEIIDTVILGALTGAGLFVASPRVWYESLAACSAVIVGGILVGAWAMDAAAQRWGTRIQPGVAKRDLIVTEAIDTAKSMFVAATLATWPMYQSRMGGEIAVTWELGGVKGAFICLVEAIVFTLFLDFCLFWKHYILHTRFFWNYHKKHHSFRDPTAFASFAVGPLESLATYWMTPLACVPLIKIYAPFNIAMIIVYIAQNLYLHCGATFAWCEWLLPKLWLNSSGYHNDHHYRTNCNFGESMLIWDAILKTRTVDYLARRKEREDASAASAAAAAAGAAAGTASTDAAGVPSPTQWHLKGG